MHFSGTTFCTRERRPTTAGNPSRMHWLRLPIAIPRCTFLTMDSHTVARVAIDVLMMLEIRKPHGGKLPSDFSTRVEDVNDEAGKGIPLVLTFRNA
jgi:hypothetical protein